MRILGRYVFREILASSLLATALATFIIFLRGISPLVELLVRSGDGMIFLQLCVLALPPVLLLSIPFGVLVGILIGLGRMSSDNEMIALRSGGVSTRVTVLPVMLFAAIAMLVSGLCAVWWSPLAIRSQYKLRNKVSASLMTANVLPQVFQEQFTNDNTVLYVDDVKSGVGPTVWTGVFIADLTPGTERRTGMKNAPTGPRITLAQEAIAIPDPAHNRIQLTLKNQSVHEAPYHSTAPRGATVLQQTQQQQVRARPYKEMVTKELWGYIKQQPRASRRASTPASNSTVASRSPSPASCWLWWGFPSAHPHARADGRPATCGPFCWRSSATTSPLSASPTPPRDPIRCLLNSRSGCPISSLVWWAS